MNIKSQFRINVFPIALITLIFFYAFTPVSGDPIDKLLESLNKWSSEKPYEKLYLHTDRSIYNIGDTIWFKAYITSSVQNKLSNLSGAVYVDLIAENDSLCQSLKFPVMSGVAAGTIILDDSITREGNYRIRAYTQWMRNAGEDYFYNRVYAVRNVLNDEVHSDIKFGTSIIKGKSGHSALIKFTDGEKLAYTKR